MRIHILLVYLLLSVLSLSSQAVELMRWDRLPLSITLNVGQERVLFIERNVKVGYPASLDGKLRIQSSGGTVYLLATEAFSSTRLQLRDIETGKLVLLDIHAHKDSENAHLEPVKLIYNDELYTNAQKDNSLVIAQPVHTTTSPAASAIPTAIALTRYAAQSLYAPLRTIEPLPGVQVISHRLPATITTLLPTEAIMATPLLAWQKDNYTVIAIRLTNTTTRPVELDPRKLQGQFYTATFQHIWLGSAGSAQDTTVVYLVTRGHHPGDALLPEPKRRSSIANKGQ